MITQLHEIIQLERPMLGLDLETTGVNADVAGIVELGLEIMKPGKDGGPVTVQEYRTLVNPMMPIPPEATAIHGITNEMVQNAPTFRQLAENLAMGMMDKETGCSAVDYCGYNLSFDFRQIAKEFERAAVTWNYEGARVLDGFRLWQIAEGRTLTHAVNRWLRDAGAAMSGVDDPELDLDAHSALWDTKMSTRIVAAQLRACASLPRNLDQLHELQFPGRFDAEGKLAWRDHGELAFTFGAHKDKPLSMVPRGYLSWVAGANFSPKVRRVCQDACRKIYPVKP